MNALFAPVADWIFTGIMTGLLILSAAILFGYIVISITWRNKK